MGEPVVFVAAAMDDAQSLNKFLESNPFSYHVVADAADLILSQFGDNSGNLAFPVHIVIDQEGTVVHQALGGMVQSGENDNSELTIKRKIIELLD
jgi:peroxiredoxin